MKITSITQAVHDAERVNIFVDDEFALGLDKQTLAEFKLFQGLEISAELLSQLKTKDTIHYLYRRLIQFWWIRPRSSTELKRKLLELIDKRKAKDNLDPESIVEAVLTKLGAAGYTDQEFAQWFTEQRRQQGKYGPQKVQAELIQKGVPPSIARQVVSESFPDDTDLAAASLQKKFGVNSIKEITDPKLKAKAYRWLISRGIKPK